MAFSIKVNGSTHSIDVDGDTPLLWVLRDVLGMTGTKFGCGMALCGACTVHLDGVAIRSCITPVESIGNSAVTTIEPIGATAAGARIQMCMNLISLADPVGFEDLDEGRASQRKLASLSFDAAGFGHGKPIARDASSQFRNKWGNESRGSAVMRQKSAA